MEKTMAQFNVSNVQTYFEAEKNEVNLDKWHSAFPAAARDYMGCLTIGAEPLRSQFGMKIRGDDGIDAYLSFDSGYGSFVVRMQRGSRGAIVDGRLNAAYPNALDRLTVPDMLCLADSAHIGALQYCGISLSAALYTAAFRVEFSTNRDLVSVAVNLASKKLFPEEFAAAFAVCSTPEDFIVLKAEAEHVLGYVPYTKAELEHDMDIFRKVEARLPSEARRAAFRSTFAVLYTKQLRGV